MHKLIDRLDSRLAGWFPKVWTWIHRKSIARGDWLPGDQRYDDPRWEDEND